MGFKKPSPAMAVAIIAVIIAIAGTGVAATGQLVNIVDPTNATRQAKVDPSGKLHVGDGNGPMSVDGTTTEAAPNTLFRSAGFPSGGCAVIATPPAGRALIVKSIALNTLSVSSPGSGTFAAFFVGTNGCESWVMDINPAGVGLINQPFEPGLAVPAGKRLWGFSNNINSEAFVFGYNVPAGAVPASAAVSGSPKARSMQR